MSLDKFEALAKKFASSQNRLKAWDAKLDNRKYFYPVIKAEWDRAFDERDRLKCKLCRMDRIRFAELFPNEPNDW